MSTQQNGIPANTLAGLAAAVNIVSSTNTNPIVITATAHGLNTGDVVSVNEHEVNVSANGTWTATRLSSNTYSIPVAGVGVGGATGTSQSTALGATFAIPSDGDAITAASVNVALEALADRTAFLGANTGEFKIAQVTGVELSTDVMSTWDHFNVGSMVDAAWNALVGGSTFVSTPAATIHEFDYVEVQVDLSCNIEQSAAHFNQMSLFATITPPGGADSYFQIAGTQRLLSVAQFVNPELHSIRFFGGFIAANSGELTVTVSGWPTNNASMSVWAFVGAWIMNVKVFRPTSMPQ